MKKTLLIGIMALHLAAGSQDVSVNSVDLDLEHGKKGAVIMASSSPAFWPTSFEFVGGCVIRREFTTTTNWIPYSEAEEIGITISNVIVTVSYKGKTNALCLESTPLGIAGLRPFALKTNETAKASIEMRAIKPPDFKRWFLMNGGPIWHTPDP